MVWKLFYPSLGFFLPLFCLLLTPHFRRHFSTLYQGACLFFVFFLFGIAVGYSYEAVIEYLTPLRANLILGCLADSLVHLFFFYLVFWMEKKQKKRILLALGYGMGEITTLGVFHFSLALACYFYPESFAPTFYDIFLQKASFFSPLLESCFTLAFFSFLAILFSLPYGWGITFLLLLLVNYFEMTSPATLIPAKGIFLVTFLIGLAFLSKAKH